MYTQTPPLGELGTKMTPPPGATQSLLQKYGPHTGVYPPDPSTERTLWYKELCAVLELPPLDELEHVAMTYILTTIGRNVDEPASEKREMRAELHKKARVIKLHALGLGPPPPNGMPTSGPTLYWSPELAFKKEVCGSLTAAETAKGIELGNKTQGMLHDRAKAKRKKLLTKFVAIAGIVAGGIFLGPKIAAAFKGAGAASAGASGAGAAGTASSVLTPITVTAKPLALVGGKVVTATAAKAATAASILKPVTVTATRLAPLATTATTAASTAATAASLGAKAAAIAPKVVQGVNATRTVAAIARGEIPPPPIDIQGSTFTDYGVSIARQLAEKELGKKAQEISDAELAKEMSALQARAQQYVPPNTAMYPSPAVNVSVQREMVKEKDTNQTLQTALMIGAPILIALLLRS